MSSKSKKKHYVLKRPRRCPCGNESIGWSAGSPICARCAIIEGKLYGPLKRINVKPYDCDQPACERSSRFCP
jgi:hypothetical protein